MRKKESITTTKTIFKIDPLVLIFGLISILIGAYKDFIIVFTLITIHELGHVLSSLFFHIKVDKITLYPLGGISKLDMDINTNPIKESIILGMGPIFQFLAYFLSCYILKEKELVREYHIGILLFNLLPIYPLDGGKLVNLGMNVFFPYRISFKLSIWISYGVTILLLFLNQKLSINMILIYIVLLFLIRKEDLKQKLYFHKFLLERLLKNYTFSKTIKIRNPKNFYRYRKNQIMIKNKVLEEKEYLLKKYENFDKNY